MAKFFTKKVCLITLAVVVALGGVIWAIVANLTPKFRSGITELPAAVQVSGNGTGSVMVDEYLYFIGDTVATSSIKYGDNDYYANGTMPKTGIYRTKIGDNAQPLVTYEYDNTGLTADDDAYDTVVSSITDWDNIGLKNNGINAVVPKIAGHDKAAMWVFGKYLIYTTPRNLLNNDGTLRSGYLDFYRVDLDGKNHTWLYTTISTDLTTDNFTVWADSTDNIYLLVSETDNASETPVTCINRVDVKTKKVTKLASEVSNVVLPVARQYKNRSENENLAKVYGGVMGNVYYTKKNRNENSTLSSYSNLLYKCSVKDGTEKEIANGASGTKATTFTPLAVTPLNTNGAVAGSQFVFSIKVVDKNGTTYVGQDLRVITDRNMDSYQYQVPGNDESTAFNASDTITVYANGFCVRKYTSSSSTVSELYHYTINGTGSIPTFDESSDHKYKVLSSNTVDKVLTVMGDTIYFQSGNMVYAVDKNGLSRSVSVSMPTTTTEETTDETEDSTTTDSGSATNTLPIAVLYQPAGTNASEPFLFVEDDHSIRLYNSKNQNFQYLRLK